MSIRWWPRKVLHTCACSSWKHSLRRPRHDRAVIERTVRADRIIVGVAADSGRIAVAISASQAISSRPAAIRPVLTQSGPRITSQALKTFAGQARRCMRSESGGYRRDHLCALAQRVEVDAKEVRIMGAENAP